ncbi:5-(carboxyamino)imidazole ribonucleotide synthase [Methylocystis parvus]|uniref:N5-carboxyaminoimidazole ribonucleotide synthase n=1 Tax=Methylocystis parvus TaxID=134 RepID=A0A6B8MDR3_9HYPH|nr:5-(carboxyamino)imidazole ribonucleotide synthase [Methylocystis parvus]QGM99709.1 5-(carboxyamino)imidazole ribonucleotide synthase [Methylocystis parvus]WBK02031.1 5-(carboxyamino)imidazole ribonucleotide synthase [Methylocystis parvus OBBP]
MLTPGATIGILGGGQLARMLALAGARIGLKSHVYSPVADDPAFDVCAAQTRADFLDEAALATFAESVDVVTYEFENVPARTAEVLEAHRPVRPNPKILALTQDRLIEKQFVRNLGVATAPFADVSDPEALARAVAELGRPAILKTRRFGYDGKGQTKIAEGVDLAAALKALGDRPCILEGFVPFAREVSVVAARGLDGEFRAYDVCENVHEHHILATTTAPAAIGDATARAAIDMARAIAEAADYVGVIAVEMFVVEDAGGERLVVNEIAPRVHNSGHWTLDGAVTSQFEQHMRAIAGMPLGSTRRHGSKVVMRNLIGADADKWAEILAQDGACLHLYGKTESRPGRKMGHVTTVTP